MSRFVFIGTASLPANTLAEIEAVRAALGAAGSASAVIFAGISPLEAVPTSQIVVAKKSNRPSVKKADPHSYRARLERGKPTISISVSEQSAYLFECLVTLEGRTRGEIFADAIALYSKTRGAKK